MKNKQPLLTCLLLASFGLSSCGYEGFSYEYGYGAVIIEISKMKLTTRDDYSFTSSETIPFGHYLEYEIDYTNIAYYWQELPHHHYYFDRIIRGLDSPYLNGNIAITCDATTIERDIPVHCSYIVLLSTSQTYELEGDVNIFVTNQKQERLLYITTNIKNNRINLNEDYE